MMPASISDLSDDLLDVVILRVRATVLSCYLGRVSSRWHERCKAIGLQPIPMLAVTMTGSNKVALIDIESGQVQHQWAALPRWRQTSVGGGPVWRRRTNNWVTGIACGEDFSLYVSQYRVYGLLKFSLSSNLAYKYVRTTATAPAPEGVVCAHGCVYAVEMAEGRSTSLRRLSPSGTLLEKVDIDLAEDSLWGMCLMPECDGLFIAAHAGEDDATSDEPTLDDNGVILAVRFSGEHRGAFKRNAFTDNAIIKPLVNDFLCAPPDFKRMPALNRPSDLVCCSHGCLFVSSFRGRAHGRERIIYKLAVRNVERFETCAYELCQVALPDDFVPECLTRLRGDPSSYGRSPGEGHRQDTLYVTGHRLDTPIDSGGAIFSFPCGCDPPGSTTEDGVFRPGVPYEDGTYDPPGDLRTGVPPTVPPVTRLTSTDLAGPHYITHVG